MGRNAPSENGCRAEAGEALFLEGDPSSGNHLKSAYNIYKKKLGPTKPETGIAAFTLGKYMLANHQVKEAEKYVLESLDIFSGSDTRMNRNALTAHAFLVRIYEMLHESEKATLHSLAVGRMTPVSCCVQD